MIARYAKLEENILKFSLDNHDIAIIMITAGRGPRGPRTPRLNDSVQDDAFNV